MTDCRWCFHAPPSSRHPGRRPAPRSRAPSPWRARRRARRRGTAPTSRGSPTSPRRRPPRRGSPPGPPARCRYRRPASPRWRSCAPRPRPSRSGAGRRRAAPRTGATPAPSHTTGISPSPPGSASAARPSGTPRCRGTRRRSSGAAPRSRPGVRWPGRRRRSGLRPLPRYRHGGLRRCRLPPPIARRRRGPRSAPPAGA